MALSNSSYPIRFRHTKPSLSLSPFHDPSLSFSLFFLFLPCPRNFLPSLSNSTHRLNQVNQVQHKPPLLLEKLRAQRATGVWGLAPMKKTEEKRWNGEDDMRGEERGEGGAAARGKKIGIELMGREMSRKVGMYVIEVKKEKVIRIIPTRVNSTPLRLNSAATQLNPT